MSPADCGKSLDARKVDGEYFFGRVQLDPIEDFGILLIDSESNITIHWIGEINRIESSTFFSRTIYCDLGETQPVIIAEQDKNRLGLTAILNVTSNK